VELVTQIGILTNQTEAAKRSGVFRSTSLPIQAMRCGMILIALPRRIMSVKEPSNALLGTAVMVIVATRW